MTGSEFRVLPAESAPGEAADSVRALYPGPDSTPELSIVSTLPTLVATTELAAREAIFLDLSLGKPGPLDAVRRVSIAPLPVFRSSFLPMSLIRATPLGADAVESELRQPGGGSRPGYYEQEKTREP
jgi:hypothetical protein